MEHFEVQQEKPQNCDLQKDAARLCQDNNALKKLHQELKSIKEGNDKTVKHYTALPSYAMPKVVLDFVCADVPNVIANCKLSSFEHIY